MGKIKLAVIGESVYMERLTECMQKHAPEYLEVLSCRGLEKVSEFTDSIQPDIILHEEKSLQEEKEEEHLIRIYLSTEKDVKENANSIFRYQRGSEILRQVFQYYERNSKKNLVCRCKTAEMEMTAFYAPGGHELQLPFSVAYATICGEDEKVLYLNLSEFSGMRMLFKQKDKDNFSDLIFGIRQKRERFLICLQSVLHQTDRFDYVLPPENPEDLYEIREDDLACLLSLLQEQTAYKKIIWNCGTLNQAAVQVMECCATVFCIRKESAFGKYRKTEFEQFLQKEMRQRLRKKVRYVCPQAGNSFAQGVDLLSQLRSGEFVKQVKAMTEQQE